MRTAFIETLLNLAKTRSDIFLLVGDLGYSVVEPFAKEFGERFINAGVAEQNMTGIAAGLALSDKTVFTYSIANFPTLRCLEQIRNDICYHNANVKIVAVGAGLTYGSQGMTHFATEDIAIMRVLPNMTIFSPADIVETNWVTRAAVDLSGPCYIRLGRIKERILHETIPDFKIGKAVVLRKGDGLAMFSTGSIASNAIKAAEKLAGDHIEVRCLNVPTIKPLDIEAIKLAASETLGIITVEEHSIIGGLGSAVTEVVTSLGCQQVPVLRLGLKDAFPTEVGSQDYLLNMSGLSTDGIYTSVLDFYKKRCIRFLS